MTHPLFSRITPRTTPFLPLIVLQDLRTAPIAELCEFVLKVVQLANLFSPNELEYLLENYKLAH